MAKKDSICEENNYRSAYNEHAEKVRNFAYYKSGSMAEAEDLMHDAFKQLWENCSKVPIESAKAFLFKVANNKFLDGIRKKNSKLNFIDRTEIRSKDNQDPGYLLEEKEFKDRLDAAIDSLPEGQREVFLMNRIDKLKYREIAEALDISVKAVEKRMHKALLKLSEELKGIKL